METELRELGLSKRESACYLALLELGSTKVGLIIKKTGIPSSKIYEVLDKLIAKGLASYVVIGGIKHYQASDPKSLVTFIEEKKRVAESILPDLIAKQHLTIRQTAGIYDGYKAVFNLFTDLISDAKPGELYLSFSLSEESKSKAANLFLRNITLRRKKKGLDVRLLKNIKDYVKEEHTKVKIRYTKFNLPQGITIFRNNLILLSWTDKPVAVKIESEVFANQMRTFFLELWGQATE